MTLLRIVLRGIFMDWNLILSYLPEALCVVVCLLGCLFNWFRTGSLKKTLQSLCPSFQPLEELTSRVNALESRFVSLAESLDELTSRVNSLESRLVTLGDTTMSDVIYIRTKIAELTSMIDDFTNI